VLGRLAGVDEITALTAQLKRMVHSGR
jgi:hypothetical protein